MKHRLCTENKNYGFMHNGLNMPDDTFWLYVYRNISGNFPSLLLVCMAVMRLNVEMMKLINALAFLCMRVCVLFIKLKCVGEKASLSTILCVNIRELTGADRTFKWKGFVSIFV